MREGLHQGPVGAKHPLLALCGADLVTAWGTNTLFLRAWRPLAESMERLRARQWFPRRGDQLQRTLWDEAEGFCTQQPHLRVEHQRLKQEPAAVLRDIIAYAHLTPTDAQLAAALAFIY